MASASEAVMTPASASEPARAASTSSMARSHASSEVVAAMASDTKIGANSPDASSERKEDGLLWALEGHVEPEGAVVPDPYEGGAPIGGARAEHRIGSVGGLAGKVQAGGHPLQEAAGEHRHVVVRRVRLGDHEPVPAVGVGEAAAEPGRTEDLHDGVGHAGA